MSGSCSYSYFWSTPVRIDDAINDPYVYIFGKDTCIHTLFQPFAILYDIIIQSSLSSSLLCFLSPRALEDFQKTLMKLERDRQRDREDYRLRARVRASSVEYERGEREGVADRK